jgi:bifunctional N-acetylglucosamine-1-phosphate-uridyltransferase/glucosamine-1-phosphate-acetyltransferase GlmU-like protein
VELKDATDGQKAIKEVNAAYYCFDADWLWQNISKLGSDNKAGEFYLTDLIAIAASQSEPINSIAITDPREGLGVNTPAQLQIAEKYLG